MDISKFKLKNLEKIFLSIILLLAAFLRLYRIGDYMTFLGDQGRDVLTVYGILHGKLTLLGPTSSVGGFFLGPIYYYFMAPFLWLFNYNPVGPAVMVALIGVATVFLIYLFCKEFFNARVGLIASLLYAISPLVIAYSRTSWNPNPLPFFALLSLFVLYKAVTSKKTIYLALSGFLLGIAMQLHYLATFLGAVMLSYVFLTEILNKKAYMNLIKKYLFLSIGFLIGWSPFLAFEVRHGFLDFKNIYNFLLYSGNTGTNSNFFLTVYDVFFRLFARLIAAFPSIEQLPRFDKSFLNLWTIAIFLLAFSSVLYISYKLYYSIKKDRIDLNKYLLISLWLFVGVLLFGFYKKPIYDYYFSFLFPLPFILTGVLISSIWGVKKYLGKIFAGGILIFLFILNIWGLPFRYEPNRQLNQMRTIADFVMTRTDAKPFNFALIADGNTDHAYRYFFTIWNHPPLTILDPKSDPQRKTVTDQLFVVCESPLPCEPLGHSLWEIAGFGRAEIAGKWQVSVVEVYKLVHYKGK